MTSDKNKLKMFEDRLSKFLAAGVFGDSTHVEIGTDLLPDSFRADVLLIPSTPLPTDIRGVGLLSRLTGDARCLIEAFSRSVSEERLEANLSKLRLALQRAYTDKQEPRFPHGVLWLVSTYWPEKPIQSVFGEQGELIEAGLRRWHGLERETIYVRAASLAAPLRHADPSRGEQARHHIPLYSFSIRSLPNHLLLCASHTSTLTSRPKRRKRLHCKTENNDQGPDLTTRKPLRLVDVSPKRCAARTALAS